MRKDLNPLRYKVGNERIIDKFLWFPKVINNELRWLERARVVQQVINVDVGGSMKYGKNKAEWVDVLWCVD